ncbi:hypothetical protein ACFQAS_09160 [Halopenitus salinus]|uniref:Uncharacterized protein n=1 Tax=Halopenitus salinus TaxID=1198295 RepID=A0ABD5UP42_9EURY
MTRDQKPVSEDEIDALREGMDQQREEIRGALAEDLGGDPSDYDAEAHLNARAGEPVTDGGEDASELPEDDPLFTGDPLLSPEDPVDETEIDDTLYERE